MKNSNSKAYNIIKHLLWALCLTVAFAVLICATGVLEVTPVYAYSYTRTDFDNADANYFVIENGVLKAYLGYGGNVVVPESVTSIADGAFKYREWKEHRNGYSYMSGVGFGYHDSYRLYLIPDESGKITLDTSNTKYTRNTSDNNVTTTNNSILSITLPSTLKSIGKDAFYGQTNLQTINIPERVQTIGEYAFYGCQNLSQVTLKLGLKTVSAHAFENCSSLASISLPSSVTSIGTGAFKGCSGIKRANLPPVLDALEEETFYGCVSMEYVIIPDGIQSIPKNTFGNCSITKIYFPDSVNRIDLFAFGNYSEQIGWNYLTDVYCASTDKRSIVNSGSNNRLFNDFNTTWHLGSTDEDVFPPGGPHGSNSGEGTNPTGGLFYDNLHTKEVGNDEIIVYANGSTINLPTGRKNVRVAQIYTDVTPSYQHKNGKPTMGKVLAVITTSSTKPQVLSGKINDKSAKNIATAKIRAGYITIKAQKEPGTVYLHVIDTGDIGTYTCCRIQVKAAPTSITVKEKKGEGDKAEYVTVKKTHVSMGDSLILYVNAEYKTGTRGTAQISDPSIIASVDKKAANYFDVIEIEPGVFKVTPKSLIEGKATKGTITFSSATNTKKGKVTVTAVNAVKEIKVAKVSNVGARTSTNYIWDAKTNTLTIRPTSSSDKIWCSYQMDLNIVPVSNLAYISESGKLLAMGLPTGYDSVSFEKGKAKIIAKPEGQQRKISAKLTKITNGSQNLTFTLNSAAPGTTAYFLLFYNNSGGYKIFTVKVEKQNGET